MYNFITQSRDRVKHAGILDSAVRMYAILDVPGGRDRDSLAGHPAIYISRATLCRVFVTAKLGTMKGVHVVAFEILNVTAQLRDGVMRDETLVICVTSELSDATVWGNELGTR